jgi:hypothetical protein
MNLLELNAQLAVRLGQSFDTLYNLEYLEYSLLLNILKKQDEKTTVAPILGSVPPVPLKVNLPDNLKLI